MIRVAGSGPPVLLLHGAEADHRMFDRLVGALADRVTAISYDQRDCETSTGADGPYDLCDLADDAAAVLREVGVPSAHIVGQSIGGVIAQLLALRHPEVVDRLVLVATFRAGASLAEINPPGVAQLLELRDAGTAEELTVFLTTDDFAAREPTALTRLAPDVSAEQRTRRLHAITTAIEPVAVDAISAPTLVIAGECDRLVPLDHARALASEFPNAQLVIVPGAGHVIPLQAPALLAAHITEFIGRFP